VYVLELAGEDDAFAAYEAGCALGHGATVVAPGLATVPEIDPERVCTLALTRVASRVVATADASVSGARDALDASDGTETAGDEGNATTVAVRAHDIRGTSGVDTQAAERALGDVLSDAGMEIDLDHPDQTLRALFAADGCWLGWEAAASRRDYGDRAPTDRPFFQPGSMPPLLARAIVNIAGASPGRTIYDPLCGTGGIPMEAALAGADVLASDAQAKMANGTQRNLAALVPAERVRGVVQADVRQLPLPDGSVHAAAFDLPYGRQSPRTGARVAADALAEARRITGRAVVVADRPLVDHATSAGWQVERRFERRVHRSLDRHIHVLTPG
jgi:tRNA (guanine10-N2)-dimethyltransferase